MKNVTDISVLTQIEAIKNRDTQPFDFEKEWENGYTVEEAKAESIRRIQSWWGKKK